MKTRPPLLALLAVAHLLASTTLATERDPEGAPALEPPRVIARDATGGVTVRAIRIPEPLIVDGFLNDDYYRDTAALDGFIQQEPREGEPATEKTEAWIFFDETNFYVGARLWDSVPEKMVANELRRDHYNISRGASFVVALDTFYDRRNGFYFETNPLGAIRDGLITNESDLNTDWNTVWNARTARFEGGWTLEMVWRLSPTRESWPRRQSHEARSFLAH